MAAALLDEARRITAGSEASLIAEEGEARAPGASRYFCVYITQLESDSSRIAELLNG